MADDPREPDLPPEPATHLRQVHSDPPWMRMLVPAGAFLLIVVALLTLFAPSVLWFLAYPLLIVGALGALAYGVAYLMRHF
jgi:hypothetical protein